MVWEGERECYNDWQPNPPNPRTGYKGHEMTTIPLNKVDDPYIVTAFSISPEHGFGLIPRPQEVRGGGVLKYSLKYFIIHFL